MDGANNRLCGTWEAPLTLGRDTYRQVARSRVARVTDNIELCARFSYRNILFPVYMNLFKGQIYTFRKLIGIITPILYNRENIKKLKTLDENVMQSENLKLSSELFYIDIIIEILK